MKKVEALAGIEKLLEQQVQQLVDQVERATPAVADSLSTELQTRQDLWGEVVAHLELLDRAVFTCELAQQGELPAGWQEQEDDTHAFILETLTRLPRNWHLSPALQEYLAQLPSQQQQDHDTLVAWLLEMEHESPADENYRLLHSTLLDRFRHLAGQSSEELVAALGRWQRGEVETQRLPFSQLTPEELRRFSSAVNTQYQELTLIAVDYAADLVRARELASQGADYAAILDYLA